ncbi:MAG: hypothetical protein KDC04_08635, partial [Saprospiraceae bacterium]|nr:hypothetical protein [Saprospiraceae bacterium]
MAWTVYKSSNSGLPYDEVGGITASEDGKIWVSTRVGVASFDGSVWKNYTIENERNINVVPQSIFWINQKYLLTSTSNSGFYQFDQDKWQKVDISFNPLGSLYTEQLFADHQSNIWLANGSYLHRYNESGWQSYLLPDKFIGSNLTAIKEDKSGKIWISKYGSGIASFDNGQFTLYDLLVLGFTPNVSLLGFDSDDNLWAATSSNGLIKFDGTAWTKVDKSNSGLPSNSVNSMALDSKGKKWFGTSEGLATFDDTTWVVYNTSNSSIPSNSVGDIHILPNDDIVLIASNNIFQFDGTTWKKFPTAFVNSFNSIITIMANSKSEFWSGMTSGLVSFMGTTVTEYSTINSPLVDNNVRSIVFDKEDKIWALSDFGISIYNPNYKVSVDDPNLTNPLKIVKVHPNPTNCLFSISNKLPGQLRLYDIS